jgi:AcrR family transcriptional regulator
MRRRTQAERRADTRARLLAAARHAFAARGYHATSADRVSELAGCTKGALYDHFGSKEGLFLALLDEQFASRIARARAVPDVAPSEAMPFDRDFALLFLEFVCAAARDQKLRRRLAARLRALRSETAARVADERLAAALGAAANGASIEALIFGEAEGSATFDAVVTALLREAA